MVWNNCSTTLDLILLDKTGDTVLLSNIPVKKEETGELVFAAGLGILFAVSLLFVVRGEKVLRPLAALVGGLVGGTLGLLFGGWFQPQLSCSIRLVLGAVFAIACSAIALCMVRLALFLVTTGTSVAIVHFVWRSTPLRSTKGPFSLLGMEGWYYIALLVAAILGAAVHRKERKWVGRAVSSAVGGAGLTTGAHLIVVRSEEENEGIPPLVFISVVMVLILFGTFAQYKIDNGAISCRREREPRFRKSRAMSLAVA